MGQGILFSTRHDGAFEEGVHGVRSTIDSSFIVFAHCQSTFNAHMGVCISLLDHDGNYYSTLSFGDSLNDYNLGDDPASKTTDGHFALSVSMGTSASLWYLNDVGDTLWTVRPFAGPADASEASGTAIARNGDLLLFGSVLHPGMAKRLFLARYSPSGIIHWLREYGDVGSWQRYAIQMDTLTNGGFVLSGMRIDLFGTDSDTWLIGADSSGTVLWEHYIDTPGEDGSRPVVSLPNNEFMVGGFIKAENPNQPGDYCCPSPYFARYTGAGDLLWDSVYVGGGNEIYSFDMCLAADGSVLSSGAAASQYGMRAYLFDVGLNGDSLWHHQYFAPDGSCINYSYLPYSLMAESQNSIVIAGVVGACNNDQWIMRTDGQCMPPPTIMLWNSIAEENHQQGEVSISPNPTSGAITIKTDASARDVDLVSVFDLSGRSVRQVTPIALSNMIDTDLGDLANGTYIVIVRDRLSHRWHKAVIKN